MAPSLLTAHWLTLLLHVTFMSPGVAGEVFTSSQKIEDMAKSEHVLLEALQNDIAASYDHLKSLSQFLFERMRTFQTPRKDSHLQTAQHPNGAYQQIQLFVKHWTPLVSSRPGLQDRLSPGYCSSLPTEEDLQGVLSSLVRLQHVYRLPAKDMLQGNYLGHQGPALSPPDTYLLGRRAFMDGFLMECMQWLQLSLRLLERQGGLFLAVTSDLNTELTPGVTMAMAAALMGRAALYKQEREMAQEMYRLAHALDPNEEDVLQLRKELGGDLLYYQHSTQSWDKNMTTLCRRPRNQTVAETLALHVCRYKRAFGPLSYLTYKEELLSVQPYVTLFHDVIRDADIDVIKGYVKGKMVRGRVGVGPDGKKELTRTSDLGWIHDHDLGTAAHLSQKIKLMTGLEVDQRQPSGPSSAEAFQVVNYGIGGLYDAHVDPFSAKDGGNPMLAGSGTRIATFLIYLSDVIKGGNTVFIKAGISVAPRKGTALFWYNVAPDMRRIDPLTLHAGCPVLVGHKWVANKWLWTHGNTFHRPCGPHANSTQIDVQSVL